MKAIAYLRVSTSEQGRSGLGLEAQQSDIESFCHANVITLIDSVSEVASAKGDYKMRPALNELLLRCRRDKCALIVSKLDRLSRDVESIANLVNDKFIRFIVVQLGLDAENFQIHLFASLAQKERDWISQRTKAALQAKKERALRDGVELKLGNRTNLPDAQAKGVATIKINADSYAANLHDLITGYQSQGKSLNEMARQLNKIGVATARGGRWYAKSLSNLVARLACDW
jgi:DNA invertase Pin-like site-specific DNA recombinase